MSWTKCIWCHELIMLTNVFVKKKSSVAVLVRPRYRTCSFTLKALFHYLFIHVYSYLLIPSVDELCTGSSSY